MNPALIYQHTVCMFYQELLLKEYPPDSVDNLEIWCSVPFYKMIESVRMQVYLPF